MPLPYVAFEGRFGVNFELVDINILAEQLSQRLDQPRMASQQTERLVESMRGKGGARGAGFFTPDLLAVEFGDRFGIIAQQRDLLLVGAVLGKKIAEFVELFEPCGAERHDTILTLACFRECVWIALNLPQSGQLFYVPRNLGLRLA